MFKTHSFHLALTGLLFTLCGLVFSSSPSYAREEDPARYVVTLLTAETPPALDEVSLDQPSLTYVSSFRRNGQTLYRLRLGFFPSRKAARKVSEGLKKRYPKAWVTRVPKKEKLRVMAGQPDPHLPALADGVIAGR